MTQANLSDGRLQELRRLMESDFGRGCQATIIVRNEKGEIVMFISGGSPEEIEIAIHKYRSQS